MDEKFELLRRYNLWNGNRIETGYERPLYTERISRYLGNLERHYPALYY